MSTSKPPDSPRVIYLIRPVTVSKAQAARLLGKRDTYVNELIEKGLLEEHVLPPSDDTKTNPPVIRYADLEALPIPLRLAPRKAS